MTYSILITTINLSKIKTCLEGMSRELDPEIIVFDHRCSKEIEELCAKHNVKYVPIGDVSFAKAANTGMKMAANETVVVMQDDIVVGDSLDRIYKQNTLKDAIHCPNLQDTRDVEHNKSVKPGIEKLDYHRDMWRGRVFACLMVERKVWDAVGGMDEIFYPCYWDDNDFLYRFIDLQKGSVYIWMDCPVAHDTLRGPANFYEALLKGGEYYSRKWGGPPQAEKFTIPFNGAKNE